MLATMMYTFEVSTIQSDEHTELSLRVLQWKIVNSELAFAGRYKIHILILQQNLDRTGLFVQRPVVFGRFPDLCVNNDHINCVVDNNDRL